MAGRSTLVKAVLTSIVVYYITVLDVPMEVLMKIDSIRRAFLWTACDKVSGGKCKVNWEKLCKPKEFGGFEIMNLKFFSSALRMRWLWSEWKDDSKPWVGLGSPCTTHDKELFAAATRMTIGNGKKGSFWESSWLDGLRPKDVAPQIFELSKKKNVKVDKALENDFWITQINMQDGFSVQHIFQFYKFWEMLQHIHLDPSNPDYISWNLSNNEAYSAKSAYMFFRPNYFHDAKVGSEALGYSKMQDIYVVDSLK